jgi:hypothetical protein
MGAQLNIQGAGSGPFYVVDGSGLYPIVSGAYGTLRDAQRSTLGLAAALAFDQGVAYSTLAPAQGQP